MKKYQQLPLRTIISGVAHVHLENKKKKYRKKGAVGRCTGKMVESRVAIKQLSMTAFFAIIVFML